MNIRFASLPIDGPLRITSKFGKRNTGITGATTNHKGIDLGRDLKKAETPILAVMPGMVIKNEWNAYRGWFVEINHGAGVSTLYQHMKEQSKAAVGLHVQAHQELGLMGNSASAIHVAVHLHFELHIDGVPVDPEPYLLSVSGTSIPPAKPEKTDSDNQEDDDMAKRYSTVKELPTYLQKETQELIDSGALAGDASGNLNITEDMIRVMIVNKRYADQLKKTV